MPLTSNELGPILHRTREAQQQWAARPLNERLEPVRKLRARLAAEPTILAEVIAREIGKTRYEAIGAEVMPVAECCRFLIQRAPRLLAPKREGLRGTIPFSGRALVRRVPWGIVASISPWNYPLFLCAAPALNALVAGNAVAMKPSPRAPETVRAFAQWLKDAGFPPDLVPVLDPSNDTGKALASSPLIDKIVFTGSSKTGRDVLRSAGENLVPATLELSGFDAVYILRDANLPLAVAAVAFGLRLNAGRSCICPRCAFVEEPVADEFIRLLTARLNSHRLLAPMDRQTLEEADALATSFASMNGVQFLNDRQRGDKDKALAVLGGPDVLAAAQGNFVPAIVVTKVKDMEEALRLESSLSYALGASIFTTDTNAAVKLAGRLRSGSIAINECVAHGGDAAIPFGGSRESGYGVRGGEDGLLEMTRPQTLAIARGTFRPHHDAETEAEEFLRALLRARHSGSLAARLKSWLDYAVEGVKWRPPAR
ncbi:MAG TPA: aldehyde dehydrogenase family protein [Planctomycetota bacterium]|jgi:acyl-CoA reductase-like NAD-dependent aldehyde dehydrogenase